MPTFDGDNLIITLDPAPGGVVTVDVQDDLYEPWKDWMRASHVNRGYPPAFRTIGGDPLSSIIRAGAYFFLQNQHGWRIKPYEQDGTWYLTGNLAAEDTTLGSTIPTTGTYTTAIIGLQPVTQGVTPVMGEQLAYASFQGSVHIDVTSPWSGNGYTTSGEPIGNVANPVNNAADALAIANERGFRSFAVYGDITLSGTDDYQHKVFLGESPTKTTLDIDPGVFVEDCEFYECHVTGTLDGGALLSRCMVDNLNYLNGFLEQCVLAPGIITLGGGVTAHFLDCWSGVPGTGTPTIDMGGSGQALALRNYNGGIRLTNKSGTESVSIDLNSGQARLTSSVTNGTVVCRGVGKLIDDATGDHILTGTWNGVTILNETISPESVWSYSRA